MSLQHSCILMTSASGRAGIAGVVSVGTHLQAASHRGLEVYASAPSLIAPVARILKGILPVHLFISLFFVSLRRCHGSPIQLMGDSQRGDANPCWAPMTDALATSSATKSMYTVGCRDKCDYHCNIYPVSCDTIQQFKYFRRTPQ